MSNIPPYQPNPPQGQQPFTPPGQGYGQGYPPQQQQMAYGMQPSRSNGWGLAALITGLVGGCLPGLGGLLAVIFGVLGIKRSRVSNSGKGMAIAGLILGLLSIVGWSIFGGTIGAVYFGTKPNREATTSYIYALDAGTLAAAGESPTQQDLDDFKAMAPAGSKVSDITTIMTAVSNGSDADTGGIINFANGEVRSYTAHQTKKNGVWKITKLQIIKDPNQK